MKLRFASKIMAPTPAPAFLRPKVVPPIAIIGAGGIVRDAHLPAYRLAEFPVAGLFDLDRAKAENLARTFGVRRVWATLEEAVRTAPAGAVFDVAVPPGALPGIVAALPEGAAALLQKPLGENLDQARHLAALCAQRRLRAAVNFQLRFAPCIVAARRLIEAGAIGAVHDLEVRVTVDTPWHLWRFLEASPRVEILYHSIHYIDLIRSFFGEPRGVLARTLRDPRSARLASTRTALLLDYGEARRATVTANHGHEFGPRHQESYVKWEGERGAIVARLGALLNYPAGEPDILEVCALGPAGEPPAWRTEPLDGNWFPHGFIGSMASVMRFAGGESEALPTAVIDAVRTMAVVEAAYASAAGAATPIPSP